MTCDESDVISRSTVRQNQALSYALAASLAFSKSRDSKEVWVRDNSYAVRTAYLNQFKFN